MEAAALDREAGFVVLHRRIGSWPLWRSLRAEQRHVVTTILLLANWAPGSFWYGTTEVKVGRGELAHSLEAIAEAAGTSTKIVRTVVAKLVSEGFLGTRPGTESGTGPRVLIVRNYDRYQSPGDETGAPPGTASGTARAQRGHGVGTAGALREPEQPEEQEQPTSVARASEPDAVRDLSLRLMAAMGVTKPMPVGARRDDDAGYIPRVRAELAAEIKRLGFDCAFAVCREAAFEAKAREGRWPSALAYFVSRLRQTAAVAEDPRAKALRERERIDAAKARHGDGWMEACSALTLERPDLTWRAAELLVAERVLGGEQRREATG
jgi:hypothetical protein